MSEVDVPPGLHADRIARGDRDHRRADRPAAPGGPGGPRGRPPGPVHQQPEADRPGAWHNYESSQRQLPARRVPRQRRRRPRLFPLRRPTRARLPAVRSCRSSSRRPMLQRLQLQRRTTRSRPNTTVIGRRRSAPTSARATPIVQDASARPGQLLQRVRQLSCPRRSCGTRAMGLDRNGLLRRPLLRARVRLRLRDRICKPDGMFSFNNVADRGITDGTSNTMAVGELRLRPARLRRGGTTGPGGPPGNNADTLANTLEPAQPPEEDRPGRPPTPALLGINVSILYHSFSSRHPGGMNAAFADGSVRFIKDTINTVPV